MEQRMSRKINLSRPRRRASSSDNAWPGRSPSVANIILVAYQERKNPDSYIHFFYQQCKENSDTNLFKVFLTVPQILILCVLASKKIHRKEYQIKEIKTTSPIDAIKYKMTIRTHRIIFIVTIFQQMLVWETPHSLKNKLNWQALISSLSISYQCLTYLQKDISYDGGDNKKERKNNIFF